MVHMGLARIVHIGLIRPGRNRIREIHERCVSNGTQLWYRIVRCAFSLGMSCLIHLVSDDVA